MWACLVLLLLFVWSCSGPKWSYSRAKERFEGFLRHASAGEEAGAIELVAEPDRKRLLAPLEHLSQKHENHPLGREDMLVVSDMISPYQLKEIGIDSASSPREPKHGDILKLKLSYLDGRTAQARMWWGGDDWYVKLF
jgi:hypothetical protein